MVFFFNKFIEFMLSIIYNGIVKEIYIGNI